MNKVVGIGLGLVLLGGFLQGSFALPMKPMTRWRWENTWLVYAIAGMLILPWVMAWMTVPHLPQAFLGAPGHILAAVALFGFGWGVGSTLFGLGIHRVGMALTFAVVLGITASLGSLLPLAVLHPEELPTRQGAFLLAGLAIVILGIVLCALAGRRRERETSRESAKTGSGGFGVGLAICILSGIFSAMLNFSFVFGTPLDQAARAQGATPAMASNAIWALALSAGFLANAGYCVYLLQKNRTWGLLTQPGVPKRYWLGAMVMGLVWFFGISFYGMGATELGALGGVLGWPVFMAMNIIAANLWGAATGEWKGTSRTTYGYSWAGISALLIAIYVISRASVA